MSDAAIATVVTGLVSVMTSVLGFLTLWVKLRYGVEPKIDNNTAVTKAGTKAATDNAKIAADAATTAADKALVTEGRLADMLNGQMDSKIRSVVKELFDPLSAAVNAHAEQDERNMAELRKSLDELKDQKNGQ